MGLMLISLSHPPPHRLKLGGLFEHRDWLLGGTCQESRGRRGIGLRLARHHGVGDDRLVGVNGDVLYDDLLLPRPRCWSSRSVSIATVREPCRRAANISYGPRNTPHDTQASWYNLSAASFAAIN